VRPIALLAAAAGQRRNVRIWDSLESRRSTSLHPPNRRELVARHAGFSRPKSANSRRMCRRSGARDRSDALTYAMGRRMAGDPRSRNPSDAFASTAGVATA
ncbi:MAG TPA: hypothetical protein VEQ63_13930, partial [Bryobacteraceae bacterium]|nr:hypothetical protein [Bryobacteraceae bacterium]